MHSSLSIGPSKLYKNYHCVYFIIDTNKML